MKTKYLLIYYKKFLEREEEGFFSRTEALIFIFENKIKDYELYKLTDGSL